MTALREALSAMLTEFGENFPPGASVAVDMAREALDSNFIEEIERDEQKQLFAAACVYYTADVELKYFALAVWAKDDVDAESEAMRILLFRATKASGCFAHHVAVVKVPVTQIRIAAAITEGRLNDWVSDMQLDTPAR